MEKGDDRLSPETKLIDVLNQSRTFAVSFVRHLDQMPDDKTKWDVLHYAFGFAIVDAMADPDVKRAIADYVWEIVRGA